MNIQKYIKVFAFILVILVAVQSFNLQKPAESKQILEDFNLSGSLKNQDLISNTKRSLQAVAVSTGTGVVLNPIDNTRFQGLTIYHQIPSNWLIG
jgi:hypothetical protein